MKPNLIKIVTEQTKRIKELEMAIPIYQSQTAIVQDISYRATLKVKLHELLLEYREITGREYDK